MTLLHHALRAGNTSLTGLRAPSLLVAGAGGALGSAVLEASLGARRFSQVRVLAKRGFTVAMNGLDAVIVDPLDDSPPTAPVADTALIVFDRERHANGRDAAFVRPAPDELPAIGLWLKRRGVRSLVVVMPHSFATLPEALKSGLANLDEHGTAALGFEQLVFVRSAQAPSSVRARQWLQRLADGVLAQLAIMVPASNQPVRAQKVARFVVELAAQLPGSMPGTRVAPPELVWQAAQMREPAALVAAWLAMEELPRIDAPRLRM